jgi:hypothetical protein
MAAQGRIASALLPRAVQLDQEKFENCFAVSRDFLALNGTYRTKFEGPYPLPDDFVVGSLEALPLSERPNDLFSRLLFGRDRTTRHRRIANHDFIKEGAHHLMGGILSPKEISVLLSRTTNEIRRIWSGLQALCDVLITSMPEIWGCRQYMNSAERIYRWMLKRSLYGVDGAVKEWKAAVNRIAKTAQRADDIGHLKSSRVLHLEKIGLPFITSIYDRGVITKGEATRLAHLTSSRGFPPAGQDTQQQALKAHYAAVMTIFPVSDRTIQEGRAIAHYVGEKIRRATAGRPLRDAGHVSLSTSSTVLYSREDGGRAAEIRAKLLEFLRVIPPQSGVWYTPLNFEIREVAGVPRWKTLGLRPDDFSLIDRELLQEDPSRSMFTPSYYGIDENTGKAIFAQAYQELCAERVLTQYPGGSHLVTRPPIVDVSIVPEPGAKARIVTKESAAVVTYLQPFGHFMNETLSNHPSAYHGLKAAEQSFEWVKSLSNLAKQGKKSFNEDTAFLTSDLKEATDHCQHTYSRCIFTAFLEGLGLGNSNYLLSCVDLLCSPRVLLGHPGAPTADSPLVTRAGALMGDPGTKALLTLCNLVAEERSFQIEQGWKLGDHLVVDHGTQWRHFSCAGDDHLASGPKSYLERIRAWHESTGMVISYDKYTVSRIMAKYAERFLYFGPTTRITELFGESSPVVDSVKIRLLSDQVKGRESEDEKNPAWGKLRFLSKQLSWLPTGWVSMKDVILQRAYSRFSHLLPWMDSRWSLMFLPTELGGMGLPYVGLREILHNDIAMCISKSHLVAITHPIARSSWKICHRLRRVSSNRYARGVSDQAITRHDLVDLMFEFCPSLRLDDVPAFLDENRGSPQHTIESWPRLRLWDRLSECTKYKIYDRTAIVQLLAKPTILTSLFVDPPGRLNSWRECRFSERYTTLESELTEALVELGLQSELAKPFQMLPYAEFERVLSTPLTPDIQVIPEEWITVWNQDDDTVIPLMEIVAKQLPNFKVPLDRLSLE